MSQTNFQNQINNHLCCAICKSNLRKIKNGLVCAKCKTLFKVKQGVPIFIDYNVLPKHTFNQIQFFEGEQEHPTLENTSNIHYWKKRYVERFMDNFRVIKNKLILDCGTGIGYMAIELAKAGGKVIACDITLKNLVLLKKFAKKMGLNSRMVFVCCSADSLPFKDSIFDYYISNAVMEHVPREKAAIAEIRRILKKGAGVMIAVPLKFRFLNPLFIPINIFHDRKLGHLRRYDEVSLAKKFAGFKLINAYYTGHFKKVIKTIINIFFDIFNENTIEEEDQKKEKTKYGSSNIICFFTKK